MPLQIATANKPQISPSATYQSRSRPCGAMNATCGTKGPPSRSPDRIAVATAAATNRGTSERVENSNSNSSSGSSTAAKGVPKMPAVPAAAPHASRIRRSAGDTGSSWPSNDPIALPVTTMGPSAPKGPPLPIAIDADAGFVTAVRGSITLCRSTTASIASGIPCPRTVGTHRAITLTARPPVAATRNSHGPGCRSLIGGGVVETCWNSATLVSRPISLTKTHADSAPRTPIGTAITLSAATRPAELRGNEMEAMTTEYIVLRYIDMPSRTVDVDYPQLLSFRTALRRFLRWSDDAAEAEGVAPAQYQLLVVVKGLSGDAAPSIGQIAEQLLLRHHSASELVHRAVEAGLVRTRPDPIDHRLIRVALTATGERVLAHLAPLHVEELARLAPLIAGLVG